MYDAFDLGFVVVVVVVVDVVVDDVAVVGEVFVNASPYARTRAYTSKLYRCRFFASSITVVDDEDDDVDSAEVVFADVVVASVLAFALASTARANAGSNRSRV